MTASDDGPTTAAQMKPNEAEQCGRLAADGRKRHGRWAGVGGVYANLSVSERVRRIILADAPFTCENEQLTRTLKISRHVLRGVYAARLEALDRQLPPV